MIKTCDVIIIGSGIAGLYAALMLKPSLDIVVLTKDRLEESNSYLAQGGIAAALGEDDSVNYHFQDTLQAGAGLCNKQALKVMVREAKDNIENLIRLGIVFDNKDNKLSLTKEGGHSRARIIHLKDFTGKGIMDGLIKEVKKRPNIKVIEHSFALGLNINSGVCKGLSALENSEIINYSAPSIILATGGLGIVYGHTTNSHTATGDAIAMAWQAGAVISNMEFIQFHPTALHTTDQQRFLISEAVRGEGAYLRNKYGRRFMDSYDSRGELAPRDIVSRAIIQEMIKTKAENVYLDLTHLDKEYIKKRFPGITARCLKEGIDLTIQMIPVSPSQHYCMGGIKTNLEGQTSIPGLYAIGETACTGVHGANRLASNSLLEAVVFARRAANKINTSRKKKYTPTPTDGYIQKRAIQGFKSIDKEKSETQQAMRYYGGIVRSREGLLKCRGILDEINASLCQKKCLDREYLECANMLAAARLIIQQALDRKKSIGSHYLL